MMKQNNPLRRLLAALLAALTLVSFTILPVLGAAEDEAADTEAAETTEATAPKAEETEMELISIFHRGRFDRPSRQSCTLDAWCAGRNTSSWSRSRPHRTDLLPHRHVRRHVRRSGPHDPRPCHHGRALPGGPDLHAPAHGPRGKSAHRGQRRPGGRPRLDPAVSSARTTARLKTAPSPARSPAAGPPAASSAKTRPAACSAAAARAAPSTVRTAPADSWAATLA